jgi:hypothetical protein
MENHVSLPESSAREFLAVFCVEVFCWASAPAVAFIFQNDKIFRPGGVESKVGDYVAGGSENRIVEFCFQVLSIFSKHYLVTRTT